MLLKNYGSKVASAASSWGFLDPAPARPATTNAWEPDTCSSTRERHWSMYSWVYLSMLSMSPRERDGGLTEGRSSSAVVRRPRVDRGWSEWPPGRYEAQLPQAAHPVVAPGGESCSDCSPSPWGAWSRRGRQDSRHIPDARIAPGEPEQDPWLGVPVGREPRAVTCSEIAPRDGRSHRTDVAFEQLAHPSHLNAAERPNRFEHNENAPWVTRQVAKLEIALGITTSNPASLQRNHTGETSAPPSFRYVVNTAGEGASRSERTPSIKSRVTSSSSSVGSTRSSSSDILRTPAHPAAWRASREAVGNRARVDA